MAIDATGGGVVEEFPNLERSCDLLFRQRKRNKLAPGWSEQL